MYFDFDDDRPDFTPVGRAISWREGVLISIILHLLLVILIIAAPDLPIFQQAEARRQAALLDANRQEAPMRFVFAQPRADVLAPTPPERPELSDEDRAARARERAVAPTNPLPFSRGDTSERVERAEREVARGDGPEPDVSAEPEAPQRSPRELEFGERPDAPPLPPPAEERVASAARGPSGGSLGEALRNLDRYVQNSQFDNQGGGTSTFGSFLQFDTRGVDFGRWVLRFMAQVERNWYPLIRQAAMLSFSGRVVLTLHVHKDGSITDLAVVGPSQVDGFNNAAYGALASSNPTVPLPPEYPADKAFFTVTFFYNERPQ
jgi:TonB family protein